MEDIYTRDWLEVWGAGRFMPLSYKLENFSLHCQRITFGK